MREVVQQLATASAAETAETRERSYRNSREANVSPAEEANGGLAAEHKHLAGLGDQWCDK